MPDLHTDRKPPSGFEYAAILQAGAGAIALLAFAYQGSFSRYMSDDYCDALIFHSGNVLQALWKRYLTISDRFSNILFVGLTEPFSPGGLRFLPALMIGLWTFGLAWLAGELRRIFRLGWPPALDAALATLLAFVSILGAPNRVQIFFWRSSMSTHFAPIVFLTFLLAFLLRQVRLAGAGALPRWAGPAAFFGAFMVAGFSEPPAFILIAASGMALLALWIWRSGLLAARALAIWTLAGASLALLVMFLAPGNSIRLGSAPPPLAALVGRTLLYAFQFIFDSLKVVPLPSLFALAVPALFFFALSLGKERLGYDQIRRLGILALVTPIILYLLIAASFAPSVYGQSFPVPRARFAAYFLQMSALILEGAFLAVMISHWLKTFPWSRSGAILALVLAGLAAFYPLRAARLAYADSADYLEWAAAWDARDALIRTQAAGGQTDLIVPGLSGIDQIKELDSRSHHWVNRCAARYYGVHSISAPPFGPD
jgi:hypothetical protein